jgi:leucyl aminopeptidase
VELNAAPAVPDGVDAVAVPGDGKVGETKVTTENGRVQVAVGVGGRSADDLRTAAAAAVRAVPKEVASVALDLGGDGYAVAEGAGLGAYRFTKFKSRTDEPALAAVTVVGASDDDVRRASIVVEAVTLARDLVNTPAGSLTPTDLANAAAGVATDKGLEIEVLDEQAAEALGLGGLLGVAAGSDQPPRLVKLTYTPPGEPVATLALVGKGITFDSGGLSLKTADGMMSMKTDMGGAAAVIAAMGAMPALDVPVKVVGYAPLTENMPGGHATKPGDVLTIRNGTTVEVLNTDAEGRLVLADGLSLAVEDGADAVVDLATLTGACITALGPRIAGLFGTSDGLMTQIQAAAERGGEQVWPMPLPDHLRPQLDSEVADLRNIAKVAKGGAIVAALFLKEFVGDTPWAHLDIAGPAWSDDVDGPITKGGTGFGVRTLLELVSSFERP